MVYTKIVSIPFFTVVFEPTFWDWPNEATASSKVEVFRVRTFLSKWISMRPHARIGLVVPDGLPYESRVQERAAQPSIGDLAAE